MEKEDLKRCLSTLEELNDLVIRLAGNARIAESILSGTEREREYNSHAICVTDCEIIQALHNIAYAKIDLEIELDHIERKSA